MLADGSPTRRMLDKFRQEFHVKTIEKVKELMRFTLKPEESLKTAYYRIRQLMKETGIRSDRDAAEDYLTAMPNRYKAKVTNALHMAQGLSTR